MESAVYNVSAERGVTVLNVQLEMSKGDGAVAMKAALVDHGHPISILSSAVCLSLMATEYTASKKMRAV